MRARRKQLFKGILISVCCSAFLIMAGNGQKWTVPIGAQVSQIVPIGKLPVNFIFGAYYNIEKPDNGPDWSLRFQIALLFPK